MASGHFTKLSKGSVHYEFEGQSNNKGHVVFITGGGSGYYCFDKNWTPVMDSGFTVLRFDFYGRGLSDRPEIEYTLDVFTDQLEELLDSLNIHDPVNLVCLSMGAMVGIDYTIKHPDRVNKLVLIDPAALNSNKKNWMISTPVVSQMLMTMYWFPRAVEKQMSEFHKPDAVADYADKLREQTQFKGFKRSMRSTWLNAMTVNQEEELYEIGKMNKPVLLFWGKYDPLTPIKLNEHYKKAIPHLRFVEVDKAGHVSNYERPDIVNPELIRFLSE